MLQLGLKEISLKEFYESGISKVVYKKKTDSITPKSPSGTHKDCEWKEKKFHILEDFKPRNFEKQSELLVKKRNLQSKVLEFSSISYK